MVALYEDGRLRLDDLITKQYPLTKVNEAVATVKQGKALHNMIIFT
ncbi:MAG: hypothetical protein GY943_12500 [Chloroflexi bacterium]|nr:hypothetical protein [Chloroflexota bacterium]